jgi:hypothetical protein
VRSGYFMCLLAYHRQVIQGPLPAGAACHAVHPRVPTSTSQSRLNGNPHTRRGWNNAKTPNQSRTTRPVNVPSLVRRFLCRCHQDRQEGGWAWRCACLLRHGQVLHLLHNPIS